MILGKVIQNVVSTKKDDSLIGTKLMIVEVMNGTERGKQFVSVDLVGAGNGEYVITVNGSAARWALRQKELPIDSVIIGIVDNYSEIGEVE
ncbi:EutN/CcmL family microcompartment protein [Vagococcus sp.]|uniref:EutN/CcmL family microcompartment protein n=1 Tax=Vagococcus sp. TaxID=1933889 RepID=UPI003F9CFEC6